MTLIQILKLENTLRLKGIIKFFNEDKILLEILPNILLQLVYLTMNLYTFA